MIIYFLRNTSLLFGGIMIDFQIIPLQQRPLDGSFTILRGLPSRIRRQIGPWCFFDKLEEPNINTTQHLGVGPHPHIGLQILSWIIDGAVQHQDSIGNRLVATAGELNFMTCGQGIVHTEDTPETLLQSGNSALHLLQFWIALPKESEEVSPGFISMSQSALPLIELEHGEGRLIAGEFEGNSSPLKTYSPIFAMELTLDIGESLLPLEKQFEYAITMIEGEVEFAALNDHQADSLHEEEITPDLLLAFKGVSQLQMIVKKRARFIIFGGLPHKEDHYIWWNYVSSDAEKIRKCHELWESGDTSIFPKIEGESRDNLKAPEFPAKLISF